MIKIREAQMVSQFFFSGAWKEIISLVAQQILFASKALSMAPLVIKIFSVTEKQRS